MCGEMSLDLCGWLCCKGKSDWSELLSSLNTIFSMTACHVWISTRSGWSNLKINYPWNLNYIKQLPSSGPSVSTTSYINTSILLTQKYLDAYKFERPIYSICLEILPTIVKCCFRKIITQALIKLFHSVNFISLEKYVVT